jgi:hypothetical protein
MSGQGNILAPAIQAAYELMDKAKDLTGLDEGQLSGLALAILVVFSLTVRFALTSTTSSKKPKAIANGENGVERGGKAKVTANGDAGKDNLQQKARDVTPLVDVTPVKASLPSSPVSPVSPPMTPPSGSPGKDVGSPQVLHSGSLKKRSMLNAALNSFELYREDDRNIAIFYTAASASNGSSGSSPRMAKTSSSMYLAPESYIEMSSRTRFSVHQLKSGGKKLQLEAKTAEDREVWVKKIQDAIDLLKTQKKI